MADTVIRIKREDGFTVLPNGLLRDPRLSLKTKGLFCMMLSFPGDWSYSIGGLVAVCGAGKDAIRGALRELETAGYLDRERSHDEGGRFAGSVYTLREVSSIPLAENPTMEEDAPMSDFPTSEKPTSENPTLQNKDNINTPYSPPEGDQPPRVKKKAKPEPDWELFERFWAAYPNKKAKERARRAWAKLCPDLALCRVMAAALERAKQSPEWRKDGGAYIPHPATWLNGRRWEDEQDPPPDVPHETPQQAPLRGQGVTYL